MTVQEKLEKLEIQLPVGIQEKGNYALCTRVGNLCCLSGQGPLCGDKVMYAGTIGKELSLEEGYEAARLTAVNILGVIQSEGYDLEKIRIIRMSGFVASAPGFYQQPEVINGATDLLCDVLGTRGCPARTAVAVPQLPFNTAVEIEVMFEVME